MNRLSRPAKPPPTAASHSEHVLTHQRRLAEDADSGRDIQAEYDPQEPELRRLPRNVYGDIRLRNEPLRRRGGNVSLRSPPGRGHAEGKRAEHHEGEVDAAHHQERFLHPDRGVRLEVAHQLDAERGTDEGAAAETHDGQAGRHARPVGEPFDEGRDRRDVAEPQADPSDHAVAEVDQPYAVDCDAQAGQPQAAAEANGAGDDGLPRADALDPPPEDRGGEAQHDQGDRIDPADLGDGPVPARDRAGDANDAGQRCVEDAEAVDLADAQMDGQGGGRDEPAVESGRGDRTLPIEEAVEGHGCSCGS